MDLANRRNGDRKIRYAVAGLGWIAQEAVLPAFKNVEKNSELAALVTDDSEKAKKLGEMYDVRTTVSYGEYDRLLASGAVDAVYIALPNSMHHDFTIRAARAGVHVLCEKPMADNVRQCEEMIRACDEAGVKLMIAYRLHFEPATLEVIRMVNSGDIGEARIFDSVFCQQVQEGNIRVRKEVGGGPLMDMGVYCINAARYLFRAEPLEVMAFGANNGERRFHGVHEMTSAVMKFPCERLATFTCSLGASPIDTYSVIGTTASLRMSPCYEYHGEMNLYITREDGETHKSFPQHDQFGAELLYFSQCILENREPEPGGREGLADIRVVEAILQSMRTGQATRLEPFEVPARPDENQKIELKKVKKPDVVHAQSPAGKT